LFSVFDQQRPTVDVYVSATDGTNRQRLLENASNAVYAMGFLRFARGDTLMAQPFDLRTLSLSGNAQPVAEEVTIAGYSSRTATFTASQNGVLVYGTAAANLQTRLQWMDRSGAVLGAIGEAAEYANVQLSPDNTMIATEINSSGPPQNRDIWIVDARRGLANRVTDDPLVDTSPFWSPDGQYVDVCRPQACRAGARRD